MRRSAAVATWGRNLAFSLTLLALVGCAPAPEALPDLSYQDLQRSYQSLKLERAQKAVACLADHGFPGAVVQEDGTTRIDNVSGQEDRYQQAMTNCLKQICEACGKPPSEAAMTKLYHLQIAAAQCLAKEGFESSDPPTLQAYLEASEESRWNPYLEVVPALGAAGRLMEVDKICPDPVNYVTYW